MSSSSARARRDNPAHRGGDPRRSKKSALPGANTIDTYIGDKAAREVARQMWNDICVIRR